MIRCQLCGNLQSAREAINARYFTMGRAPHETRKAVCERCLTLHGSELAVIAALQRLEPAAPQPDTRNPKAIRHEKMTDEQLANKYAHHTPFGDQAERYAKIRAAALEFARVVRDNTPTTPEQTRAFNEIHLAMMIANSAIALNEKPPT